jgi:hypothetical protein
MAKHLILADDELDTKVGQLIDERLVEVRERFLEQKYLNDSEAYSNARELLDHPEQELDELLSHLVAATLSKIVAAEYSVTIVDAHAGLWRRINSRRRVNGERRRDLGFRNKRLAYITQRQQELTDLNNGLLMAIAEKGWDLVIIISMRNQYEKRINALPPKDAKSVIKRLAVFEKITRQFRDDYIEKTNANSPKTGLQFAHTLTEEVNALLLQIFDLSTVQKNQLLVHAKEYRELATERQTIIGKK